MVHCLRSHPINFEDNRINSDECIVLLRFFGGHLENNTFLEIFTEILCNNYLLDFILPKTNYSEYLLQSVFSASTRQLLWGERGFLMTTVAHVVFNEFLSKFHTILHIVSGLTKSILRTIG